MGTARDKWLLIVDDDFDIRETVSRILALEGYHVEVAANGEEALALLRARTGARLVLLDLMMPVMNGWQFRSEQAADPAISTIPVVVLSGAGVLGQKAPALGAADFLEKPLDLERLLAVVERYCH